MRLESITKLISGGQTGADRAALEVAYETGITTGGWAPKDFLTTRGKDPTLGSKFKLQELLVDKKGKSFTSSSQMYVARSMKNVDDSDATIAFRVIPSKGTDGTIGYCMTKKWEMTQCLESLYKPCLVISDFKDIDTNVRRIKEFLLVNRVNTLNVAGHRDEVVESYSENIKSLLTKVFQVQQK